MGIAELESRQQPYDIMGSVLIEYDVRVQPRVLTVGGTGERSDSFG
jgi:hypothetical protein